MALSAYWAIPDTGGTRGGHAELLVETAVAQLEARQKLVGVFFGEGLGIGAGLDTGPAVRAYLSNLVQWIGLQRGIRNQRTQPEADSILGADESIVHAQLSEPAADGGVALRPLVELDRTHLLYRQIGEAASTRDRGGHDLKPAVIQETAQVVGDGHQVQVQGIVLHPLIDLNGGGQSVRPAAVLLFGEHLGADHEVPPLGHRLEDRQGERDDRLCNGKKAQRAVTFRSVSPSID